MRLLSVVWLVVALTHTTAFLCPVPSPSSSSRMITRVYAEGEDAPAAAEEATPAPAKKSNFKGFGEKPTKKAPPPKTKAQLDREKYAKSYDELAQKGVPEYAVYIREAAATDQDWKFVGSMAVPRNAKIESAIYDNEVNLVKGAYKLHPKLVGKEAEGFVYGYNLKKFPDEPIKLAVKPTGESKNPVIGWLENVLSPLDASNIKGQ